MSDKCAHTTFDENCGWCIADYKEVEREDVIRSVRKIDSFLSELYAIRGEDRAIARICELAMKETKAWV